MSSSYLSCLLLPWTFRPRSGVLADTLDCVWWKDWNSSVWSTNPHPHCCPSSRVYVTLNPAPDERPRVWGLRCLMPHTHSSSVWGLWGGSPWLWISLVQSWKGNEDSNGENGQEDHPHLSVFHSPTPSAWTSGTASLQPLRDRWKERSHSHLILNDPHHEIQQALVFTTELEERRRGACFNRHTSACQRTRKC